MFPRLFDQVGQSKKTDAVSSLFAVEYDDRDSEAPREEKQESKEGCCARVTNRLKNARMIDIFRSIESRVPHIPVISTFCLDTSSLFRLAMSMLKLAIPEASAVLVVNELMSEHNSLESTFDRLYMNYLTSPEQALAEVKFNQSEFINLVCQHYRDLNFNAKGECYGFMMAWHAYSLMGKDFFAELNTIRSAMISGLALNTEQLKLLKNINHAQQNQVVFLQVEFHNQQHDITRKKVERFNVLHDNHFSAHIESLAKQATQQALDNPGQLIKLSPRNERAGHAIGLTAVKQNGKMIIKYFDSNYREASFADPAAAATSAANLLCFAYANYLKRYAYEAEAELNNFSITTFESSYSRELSPHIAINMFSSHSIVPSPIVTSSTLVPDSRYTRG